MMMIRNGAFLRSATKWTLKWSKIYVRRPNNALFLNSIAYEICMNIFSLSKNENIIDLVKF